MARKRIVTLISDLSGEEAENTVEFSVGSKRYRIDLTNAERDKFHDALAPYVENAERVTKKGTRTRAQR